ncbi:NAD(P)H-hydrate dehydratase [Variovorax sp. J22P168]|uniref:NAD(P)H-hydrate dehydratase n=1 Tax=Variovorax jilinensis TaxID=3053513 RepID=UPI002577EF0F|nr:NAD(P)H-hydrate dehydratase [Variovorax sp. J22P168]MDM0015493.1 NAD(P)H-hydrate dehydratase [Variovorax sp. J22P168]
MKVHAPSAKALTPALLARWPFPNHGVDADKEARGHVLVIGGSVETPGAVALAAIAALRAGAGKLTVAVPASVAQGLALTIPESRVIGLPQSTGGSFLAQGADKLAPLAGGVDAVVLGPGMLDAPASLAFVRKLLSHFPHSTVVLDAFAMGVVEQGALDPRVIMTPHAGEMAKLSSTTKEAVCDDPLTSAVAAATLWNACVVLKGACTFIAQADGTTWRHEGATPGLATSGSGDTLAGLIGGLAARGLTPPVAAAWGVVIHSRAGEVLARRYGPLGFLAGELSAEFPKLIHAAHHRQRRP